MTERISENDLPESQLAKAALKKAGEDPDPGLLYLLQLAQWALESGKVDVVSEDLPENLEVLLGWDQANVAKLLNLKEENPFRGLSRKDRKDPVSLGVEVLEHLHLRLMENAEGYPGKMRAPTNYA